ncbi:MAG: hypothetical protein ACOC41_05625 [Chitinivibrionales bacterium]
MRKKLVCVLLCSTFSLLHASDWATSDGSCYARGDQFISVGVSVFHFGGYAVFDYAVHDAISVGGGIGYNGYGFSRLWRYNYIPIAMRGSFHPFNLEVLADRISVRDKLDPYIGVAMGWNIGWATWKGNGDEITAPNVGGFLFRENIGIRFYPADRFYIYAEEGAGFGNINFGVGFKL